MLAEIEPQTYSDNYDLYVEEDAEAQQSEILQIEMADLLLFKGFLTGDRATYLSICCASFVGVLEQMLQQDFY